MLGNWIKQTTTTTGTGSLTLSAATGYPTFADQFAVNQPLYYNILDSTGAPIECGIGKLTSSTVLARTQVLQTYTGGTFTNIGATAVSLSAGTYTVVCAAVMQQGGVTSFPGITSVATLRAMIAYPFVGSANVKALTLNTPAFMPVRIDAGKGVSALGIEVTTLGGTGSDKVRCGLYPVNADGSPGDLIAQSGDMLPNTTGLKSATLVGGTMNVPPGWYYFMMLSSVNVTVRAASNSFLAQSTHMGMGTSTSPYGFGQASAVGGGWTVLPTTFTVAGLQTLAADFPPCPYVYL